MRTVSAFVIFTLIACGGSQRGGARPTAFQTEAQAFLDAYGIRYRDLSTASSEAEWLGATRIVEGDDTNAKLIQATNEAYAAFVGSVENIATAKRFLARKADLTDLQVRQLQAILFKAGSKPQTIPDVVSARIAAETAQSEKLYSFEFVLDGKTVTTTDLEALLLSETDVARRLAIWEASKTVGPAVKDGLVALRALRNATVQPLGYHDYFSYMVSEYGMTTDEMMSFMDELNRELRPLYRELHTWARYELAAKYGQPVPELLPAHWLPNRWGQDWSPLVTVAGMDLDKALVGREPEWMVKQAERFYVSLGFAPLPATFWERSSLYPAAPDAAYKKNNHASAWHVDLEQDVRCLMSTVATTDYYDTTHHELGHIYYFLSCARPEVPYVLRGGANRGYHEAVGSLMGFAAVQPRFVASVGLDVGSVPPDEVQLLLRTALANVVFIPFSTGTMARFERDLYVDELPPDEWNARWWELAARYQGIAPPSPRGEEWCDACTKTHINDDPAGYYDYAVSLALLFQFHDHIARHILKEDPHDTNYFGRKDVGDFLRAIMAPGATVDWRQLLKETTGQELSGKAMAAYFQPLMDWLMTQNKGRKHTLPDL